MKKLCIFDLDGTLINSLFDLADAMNYALERNGFPTHEREKYRFMVGSGISVLADRAMVVPGGTDEGKKAAVLADFNSYYTKNCLNLTVPYDGITDMLKELEARGICCAVLSNKPDAFVGKIIDALFIGYPFAAVWGKRKEYPRKPDPASVRAMLSSLGTEEKDCLYIGDSNIDMQTAKNAGITAVGVSWGFRPVSELRESGADFIAQAPADILKYL